MLLAKVADKEPLIVEVWGVSIALASACFYLPKWKAKGAFLAVLLSAGLLYATYSWLEDSNEGTAVVRELGRSYVAQAAIAAFLPLVFAITGIICRKKRAEPAATAQRL